MQAILEELSRLLHGGNYEVHLDARVCPFHPGYFGEDYVREVWGPKYSLERVNTVEPDGLLYEVDECLRYAGDAGHGPDAAALESERFAQLMDALLTQLRGAADRSEILARVAFKHHPHGPVFWDFAFVVASPADGALVLVGSSTD